MSSLTKQNITEDKRGSDFSKTLLEIMERTGASYIHIFYNLVGAKFFDNAFQTTLKAVNGTFAADVKQALEVIISGKPLTKITHFPADEFFADTAYLGDPATFSLLPIEFSGKQGGILALGFSGQSAPDLNISPLLFDTLSHTIHSSVGTTFQDLEQLPGLMRALSNVKTPSQLAYAIAKTNPVFRLSSSTIVCLREGLEGTEYLIYLPENYLDSHTPITSFEGLGFQVIEPGTNQFLYDFLNRADAEETSSTLSLDAYPERDDMHPYLKKYHLKGANQAVAYHLVQENKIIGFWLTLSLDRDHTLGFTSSQLEPFISQMSTTVNNINIYSELEEKRKESEILMSLNIDLAATRDKKNLLKLIRSRLNNLFTFSHHFVCKINERDMSISLLLSDAQSPSRFHPLYESVKHAKFPIVNNIYDLIIRSSKPVIVDLASLARKEKLPPQLQVNFESGIDKVVMVSLRVDSKLQGIWTIAFTPSQPVLVKHLKLIKTVAAPISIAVANIRVSDSLRKKEEEREKIMAMSFELTAIRNKKELISTLEAYLPGMFNFQSLFIFLDGFSGANEPFILIGKDGEKRPDFKHSTEIKKSKTIFDYNAIFDSSTIISKEILSLMNLHRELELLETEYSLGARSLVSIPLRNDNRIIGVMVIFLSEGMRFPSYHHNLFKVVSYQISTSISDLLLNEDLRRRELEKELLLSLSGDIASVRDKKQMASIIKSRLKPTLGFTHFALGVKVPDNTIVSFLSDPESKALKHPDYPSVFKQSRGACEEFIDFVNQSPHPVILNKDNISQFAQLPDVIHVNFESGVKEILIAKLFDGVSIFGYSFFFFDKLGMVSKDHFSLIKGIANQFATAIYNIKANLEIINREKDNELLISLSNTTAGLRNFPQLMDLVSSRFANVFFFERFFMGLLDEDGVSVNILSSSAALPDREIKPLSEASILKIHLDQDFYRQLISTSSPMILDLRSDHRISLDRLVDNLAFSYAVLCRFIHNQKLIGIWIMLYKDLASINTGLFRLLQGVSDQLSNSVANILANERLYQTEMKKSILLSLSKNISTSRNPRDLPKILEREMREILYFDANLIAQLAHDSDNIILWGSLGEDSKYSKKTGRALPLPELTADVMPGSEAIRLIDLIGIDLKAEESSLLSDGIRNGMNYLLQVKLISRADSLGYWLLWYKDRPALPGPRLELLEEVATIIATTISNISFNDRLNRREQEKTSLLGFTQAIAGIHDRFQLRNIFNRYLKNLCLIEDISLHWFSDDKKFQTCYFWDENAPGVSESGIQDFLNQEFPIHDDIFSTILNEAEMRNVKVSDYIGLTEVPAYINFLCRQNCEHIIGVPLFRGKEIVGVLFVKEFDAHNADQPLFRGLCTQLAIAISNLVASERILRQLSQIKMYQERLEEEKVYLKQELETSHHYTEIIGEGEHIRTVFRLVSQVANSDSTVLILGETGTGKELIARAIHSNSNRKSKLLVKVNCAALPANLIESELFGHEKGAFTGATERRIGKFELANGGSLFLDEIGEMPPELQVKLLRALQEREIERVGGKGTIHIDVRIISATNRNLEEQVNQGNFRSDLYFRLSTFPIHLPALRDRKTDIPLLASHFLNRFSKKSGKDMINISQRAMLELINYNWPGNVRELEHQIERSVIMTEGNIIKGFHLPGPALIAAGNNQDEATSLRTIDEHERDLIIRTLRYCKGKVSGQGGAAEILGVPSTTLNAKIKRLGIKKNFSR